MVRMGSTGPRRGVNRIPVTVSNDCCHVAEPQGIPGGLSYIMPGMYTQGQCQQLSTKKKHPGYDQSETTPASWVLQWQALPTHHLIPCLRTYHKSLNTDWCVFSPQNIRVDTIFESCYFAYYCRSRRHAILQILQQSKTTSQPVCHQPSVHLCLHKLQEQAASTTPLDWITRAPQKIESAKNCSTV